MILTASILLFYLIVFSNQKSPKNNICKNALFDVPLIFNVFITPNHCKTHEKYFIYFLNHHSFNIIFPGFGVVKFDVTAVCGCNCAAKIVLFINFTLILGTQFRFL